MGERTEQIEIAGYERLFFGARPPFNLALCSKCTVAFGEFLSPE